MQMIVKGHHIHVSDHLKETATSKIEKLSRFFDRIQKMEIDFQHDHAVTSKNKHRVEAVLTTPLGTVRAHAKAMDPETALDSVVDKLERQLIKLKDKVVRVPKGGVRAKASSQARLDTAQLPTPSRPTGTNGTLAKSLEAKG